MKFKREKQRYCHPDGRCCGKLRKIGVSLTEPEYTLAIKAYQELLPVVCTGDLIKEHGSFVLKNPATLLWTTWGQIEEKDERP